MQGDYILIFQGCLLYGHPWKDSQKLRILLLRQYPETQQTHGELSPNNPVQFSSVAQSCLTLCDPMDCSMPGFPVHHQLPELVQTHVHRVGDAIQPSHPLLSPSLPAFNLSQHQEGKSFPSSLNQFFASGGQSIGASASGSVLPMNIQDWFPLGWLDLPAVQGTLKSLRQHHRSKASILQHSAFFVVQLSHPYLTTGKIVALTKWIFVGKIMSLLFNMLSGLVITFLPRSKCLLISWLQSPSAVIWESLQNKVWHCFHCFPIYFPWSDGTRCHDLRFLNVELIIRGL